MVALMHDLKWAWFMQDSQRVLEIITECSLLVSEQGVDLTIDDGLQVLLTYVHCIEGIEIKNPEVAATVARIAFAMGRAYEADGDIRDSSDFEVLAGLTAG